jgi:hypothetical protein
LQANRLTMYPLDALRLVLLLSAAATLLLTLAA